MDSIMDNLPVECKTDTELLASYQNGLLPVELTENDDSHSDSKEKRVLTQAYLDSYSTGKFTGRANIFTAYSAGVSVLQCSLSLRTQQIIWTSLR